MPTLRKKPSNIDTMSFYCNHMADQGWKTQIQNRNQGDNFLNTSTHK